MNLKKLLAIQIALVALLVSCNSGEVYVKVKDHDDYYRFTAKFNPDLSPRISRFISNEITTVRINPESDSKIVTVLNDNTKLSIESSPGEVMVYLDKEENGPASYHRVKNMCEGIKNIIADAKE